MTALCGLFYGSNKMATDVGVQYFSHLNGLTLGNNWGDLVQLLDKCLVNGIPLTSITSASVDTQGDITLNLYAAHNCMLFQIVELTGFTPSELNGKYRIKGVPTATQLILKSAHIGKTITTTGSAKLAPLGYDIIFRDTNDVKRVYRAKNPRTEHPFIRVDESISDGTNSYTSTYAKYAMVGLLEHMDHIDDYENPDVLQLPFEPSNPAKNWKITGTGTSVVRGWSRWYWSRSNLPAAYVNSNDASGGGSGNKYFSLIGDNDAFYFLTEHIGTGTGKILNGVGCVKTSQNPFRPNWFLMCTLSNRAANGSNYWSADGFQPLMNNANAGQFYCTPDSPGTLNHLIGKPIIFDFASGRSNTFDGNNIPAIEIPFYDSVKKLRGCLPHIAYAGRIITTSYTQPKLDGNSMYISDIAMSTSDIGGFYFYLGELE